MRKLICLGVAALLCGCSTSDPGPGAGIDYHMPRTNVSVTLGIDVADCGKYPTNIVAINFTLKTEAVAGVQPEVYHLAGKDLISASTKRKLVLQVDENGVLSSINSTATDQRTVILGNIIKIAAAVVKAAGSKSDVDHWLLSCTPVASVALTQVASISAQISALRSKIATDPSPDKIEQQINLLAAQIVTLKASLHRDIMTTVDLSGTWASETLIKFKLQPLDELLTATNVKPGASSVPVPPSQVSDFDTLEVYGHYIDQTRVATVAVYPPSSESTKPCEQTIAVPAPKAVSFIIEPKGEYFAGRSSSPGNGVAYVNLVAAQLAPAARLCISARFGENRTINMDFTKFGQVKSFTWDADSQAAAVTTALAGASSDASTSVTTLEGESLAAQKAKLDALQTGQNLRKAEKCQALLDAGASTCP